MVVRLLGLEFWRSLLSESILIDGWCTIVDSFEWNIVVGWNVGVIVCSLNIKVRRLQNHRLKIMTYMLLLLYVLMFAFYRERERSY